MALIYPPKVGEIFMCEFPPCLVEPEMIKTRAVIVVSPKCDGRKMLWTVVPLSLTPPDPIRAYHCLVPARFLPKGMRATGGDRWAKCDMVYSLCQDRLTLCRGSKDRTTGKRVYDKGRVDLAHLQQIRCCIAQSLGIGKDLFIEKIPDKTAA